MKNSFFDIQFDLASGGVKSIVHPDDENRMNWCEGSSVWGVLKGMELVSCSPSGQGLEAVYKKGSLQVEVSRGFDAPELYRERYVFKNCGSIDLFFKRGDLGVYATFNDSYESAEVCLRSRCHAHVWRGGQGAYVKALRMGPSGANLGLALTKGSIDAYSVERDLARGSNDRGDIVLHPAPFSLMSGESYVLEWKLFWHRGDDFRAKLLSCSAAPLLSCEQETVFEGETIEIKGESPRPISSVTASLDGAPLECSVDGRSLKLSFKPRCLGEHRFDFEVDGVKTFALCHVSLDFESLVDRRLKFIAERQQFRKPGSPLDGAFLIYDNADERQFFSEEVRDHNAARERLGMGILMARRLQSRPDATLRAGLDALERFVRREIFDEATGRTFDSVGKNPTFLRLYNAPWMSTFWLELFLLKKDALYLDLLFKTLANYYENGGERFYPNGLSMHESVEALRGAGRVEQAEKLVALFRGHVERIVSNGLEYPKHEVNFEQTIVTPAVTYICSFFKIEPSDRLFREARRHIEILDRFSGEQPDFHLDEIPIRHWDDFWFGKSALYGDTFPHYWSCLSARSCKEFYDISGEARYLEKARRCLRNCLCLFKPDGRASCAYVYPFSCNGRRGEFFDDWANDQDFALYFMLKLGCVK